jgi:hypothetical protein
MRKEFHSCQRQRGWRHNGTWRKVRAVMELPAAAASDIEIYPGMCKHLKKSGSQPQYYSRYQHQFNIFFLVP